MKVITVRDTATEVWTSITISDELWNDLGIDQNATAVTMSTLHRHFEHQDDIRKAKEK